MSYNPPNSRMRVAGSDSADPPHDWARGTWKGGLQPSAMAHRPPFSIPIEFHHVCVKSGQWQTSAIPLAPWRVLSPTWTGG